MMEDRLFSGSSRYPRSSILYLRNLSLSQTERTMGKKDKKGCGCLGAFLVVFFVLPVVLAGVGAVVDYLDQRKERAFKTHWAAFFDPFDAAANDLTTGDFLAALAAADQALSVALAHPELGTHYVAQTYAYKAKAHIGLWQYIDAETTIQQALPYADALLQATLTRMLDEVQGRITDNDTERNEQHIYHASPGIGPARTLHGKVVIAYVFVDDGHHSTWSLKSEQYVLRQLDRVQRWFQAQAQGYGITGLRFTRRIFHYDKDPWLRNALPSLRIDDAQTGYDIAQRAADLQGAPSVNAFLYRLIRQEAADQALLLLHVNLDKRSFAHRCWTRCPEQAEYAYLLKSPKRRSWDAMAYVQAHEALHLFGADDLYNLQGGSYYAPRDIMHHSARYIEASTLDSITAFGVGWVDQPPHALPFPLQQADTEP